MAIVPRRTLTTRDRQSERNRSALRGLPPAGLVGLLLLAAACGGGTSGANVAHVGTTNHANGSGSSNASASDDPNAYPKCMRSHGVGNFPDPDSNNALRMDGIDRNSPTFKAAARACRSLAPTPAPPAQQAQDQAQMLAFAQCMRSHGVPAFPDPQATNGAPNLTPGQINPNSPIVKAAIAACRSKFVGKDGAMQAQKLLHGLEGAP